MAMKLNASVTARGDNWLVQSVKELAEARRHYVKVGFVQNMRQNRTDMPGTNAFIGYVQEHGVPSRGIPARPFLIPAFLDCADDAEAYIRQGFEEALTDKGAVARGLGYAGSLIRNRAKDRIVDSEGFDPLKPATLKHRKRIGFKGTKPLIHTGQLLNAITYKVE